MNDTTTTRNPALVSFYSKSWTIIGTILLFLTLNIWMASQKWGIYIPVGPDFQQIDTYALGIYGILGCYFLIIIQIFIGIKYIHLLIDSTFLARVPPILNWSLPIHTFEGKLLKSTSLFLFFLFPLAGQIHFTNKFLHGSISIENRGTITVFDDFTTYTSISDAFSGAHHFNGGIDYYPFWETWFLSFLQLILFGLAFHYLLMLKLKQKKKLKKI